MARIQLAHGDLLTVRPYITHGQTVAKYVLVKGGELIQICHSHHDRRPILLH